MFRGERRAALRHEERPGFVVGLRQLRPRLGQIFAEPGERALANRDHPILAALALAHAHRASGKVEVGRREPQRLQAAQANAGADGASEATDASEEDSRASDSSELAQSWRAMCRRLIGPRRDCKLQSLTSFSGFFALWFDLYGSLL